MNEMELDLLQRQERRWNPLLELVTRTDAEAQLHAELVRWTDNLPTTLVAIACALVILPRHHQLATALQSELVDMAFARADFSALGEAIRRIEGFLMTAHWSEEAIGAIAQLAYDRLSQQLF